MRVGVIGVNHKLADLKLREEFAKICHDRFCIGKSTHGHHTLVLLSTCNRTEVYFSSRNLAETHSYIINILRRDLNTTEETFDQKLYSYFGHDCFSHLARVTAGLDSAIVAETEIQGQVKTAYENAQKYLIFPSEMHYLFQKSLKIGKQIRTELPLGRGVPDIEHAILNAGFQTLSEPEKSRILFVGASDINRKIVSFLRCKKFENISICNRSPETAMLFARKYNLKMLHWLQLSDWHLFDWIIFGTKSSEHVISKRNLSEKLTQHKLIIDLSVPRNVEPKLGRDPRITLMNIDQINRTLSARRGRMAHLLTRAEDMVNVATRRQIQLFQTKEHKRVHLKAVS